MAVVAIWETVFTYACVCVVTDIIVVANDVAVAVVVVVKTSLFSNLL